MQSYSTEAAKGEKLDLVCRALLDERCLADEVGELAEEAEDGGDGETEVGEADGNGSLFCDFQHEGVIDDFHYDGAFVDCHCEERFRELR